MLYTVLQIVSIKEKVYKTTTMNSKSYRNEIFEELEDFEHLPTIRNLRRRGARVERKKGTKPNTLKSKRDTIADLGDQGDGQGTFEFTYNASRHERRWIIDSLGGFYEGHWLDDILRLLKGGKEASVYQCAANPAVDLTSDYIAAKVYRPRQFRNLKNDHLYREGRTSLDQDGVQITDDRTLHAIRKRTEYGRRMMHTSWIEHEFQTMQVLNACGADIPIPYARGDNAILMEYIGNEQTAAPTLNTVKLEFDEARELVDRLLYNLDLMLANQRVHADFSAYNILYWNGDVKIIDFPQAINPHENRNAYWIFQRDVQRLCEYFQSQGLQLKPKQIADEIWTGHGLPVKRQPDPAFLDDQNDEDLRFWHNNVGPIT